MTPRRTRAPGKLILSGEHAVVHGAPALAVAVSLYARVEATPLPEPVLEWHLPGASPLRISLQDTHTRAADLDARHRRFLQGGLDIAAVAPLPVDLLTAAAARARPQHGWRLTFASDIPPGAGMGSSAAFLLALFKALRPEWDAHTLYREALACEQYQHGRSSGLDVAVSLHGGALWMHRSAHRPLDLPTLPEFRAIHTGRPARTTGECVTDVSARFPDGHPHWTAFEAIALRTREALQKPDPDAWTRAIRENHRLLTDIGVVPGPVQTAIADMEAAGGAAKICGAGCLRGPAAGVLLARDPLPRTLPAGWRLLSLAPDTTGARLEDLSAPAPPPISATTPAPHTPDAPSPAAPATADRTSPPPTRNTPR